MDNEPYDPINVEATLGHDGINLILNFEYDGEQHDRLMQFGPDHEVLLNDAAPDEEGVSSMEEAMEEARKGYDVDILIHQARAHAWSKAVLEF